MSTVFGSTQSTAVPPPTELKYPAVVMKSHQMVVSQSLLDQMMMMIMIILRWKISKSNVVVLKKGCMQPRRKDHERRLGIGCGRGGCGTFSQAMCGLGWEGY